MRTNKCFNEKTAPYTNIACKITSFYINIGKMIIADSFSSHFNALEGDAIFNATKEQTQLHF